MATDNTRLEYLKALLNQKAQQQANGNNLVNPSIDNNIDTLAYNDTLFNGTTNSVVPNLNEDLSKTTNPNDDLNFFQKVDGFIDELGANFYTGLFKGVEGFLDIGANILGSITGNETFTDWAKQDISGALGEWTKTYSGDNVGLVPIIRNIVEGKYTPEYWDRMFNSLGDALKSASFMQNELNYDFDELSKQDHRNDYKIQTEFGNQVAGVVQSFGEMLPSIAIGGGVGNSVSSTLSSFESIAGKELTTKIASKIARGVGLAAFGAAAAGNASEQALNDGATANEALTEGAISGTVEVLSEIIVGNVLNLGAKALGLDKLVGKFGNNIQGIKLSTEALTKGQIAKEIGKSMFEEGAEEVFSEIFSPIAEYFGHKGDDAWVGENGKFIYADSSFWKEVGLSFASGAAMGGFSSSFEKIGNYATFGGAKGVNAVGAASNSNIVQEKYNELKFKGLTDEQVFDALNNDKEIKELTQGKDVREYYAEQLGVMVENITALLKEKPDKAKNVLRLLGGDAQMLDAWKKASSNTISESDKKLAEKYSLANYKPRTETEKMFFNNWIDKATGYANGIGANTTVIVVDPEDMADYRIIEEKYGVKFKKSDIDGSGGNFLGSDGLNFFDTEGGQVVLVSPYYEQDVSTLFLHEVIEHSFLDSDKTGRSNLLKDLMENKEFEKLYNETKEKIEKKYKEQISEKKTQEEKNDLIESETLAYIISNSINNESFWDEISTASLNKLGRFLNKVLNKLSLGKKKDKIQRNVEKSLNKFITEEVNKRVQMRAESIKSLNDRRVEAIKKKGKELRKTLSEREVTEEEAIQMRLDAENEARKLAKKEAGDYAYVNTLKDIPDLTIRFSNITLNDRVDKDGNLVKGTQTKLKEELTEQLKKKGYSDADIKYNVDNVLEQVENISNVLTEYAKTHNFDSLKAYLEADPVISVYNGKPVFTAMIANGDYVLNFDFSATCKKRIGYQKVLEYLCENDFFNSTSLLKQENIAKINEILTNHGVETPCRMCFVEAKRLYQQDWARNSIQLWNKAVELIQGDAIGKLGGTRDSRNLIDWVFGENNASNNLDKEIQDLKKQDTSLQATKKISDDSNYSPTKKQLIEMNAAALKSKDLDKLTDKSNPARVFRIVNKLAQSSNKPLPELRYSDLLTGEGLKALKDLSPEFYSFCLSSYGAGTPKINRSFTPYNSEIFSLIDSQFLKDTMNKTLGSKYTDLYKENIAKGQSEKQAKINALRSFSYLIGGVRYQSFSDGQITQFLDTIQFIADLSAYELPMHMYTKEAWEVKLLGLTRAKINMSLISYFFDETNNESMSGIRLATDSELEDRGKDYEQLKDKANRGRIYADFVVDKATGEPILVNRKAKTNKKTKKTTYSGGDMVIANEDGTIPEKILKKYGDTVTLKTYTTDFATTDHIKETFNKGNKYEHDGKPIQSFLYDQALDLLEYGIDEKTRGLYKGYSKNCGTIAIAFSDAHARMLMRSPYISMVIPYHKSGVIKGYAKTYKFDGAKDFTPFQEEKMVSGSKKIYKVNKDGTRKLVDASTISNKKIVETFQANFNINYLLSKEGLGLTPEKAIKKYLNNCWDGVNNKNIYKATIVSDKNTYEIECKITPKFASLTNEKNYYKVLTDFTLFDKDGNYSPQSAVTLKLPDNANEIILKTLDQFLSSEKHLNENFDGIIKDLKKELDFSDSNKKETKGSGIRHSIIDLENKKQGLFISNNEIRRALDSEKTQTIQNGDVITLDRPKSSLNRVHSGYAPTLTTHGSGNYAIMVNGEPRRFTPKEAWMLTGFTKEQYEKAAKVNKQTALFRQAGNSIVVPVLESIINVLDLPKNVKLEEHFAGIGAIRQALINQGFNVESTGVVEYNKNAVKTYNALYGTNVAPTDVRDYVKNVEPHYSDIFLFGSPCVNNSSANSKGISGFARGTDNESALFWDSLDYAKKSKPKYVIWENVENVVTRKALKPTFDQVIKEMEEAGYKVSYKVLDARDFGVPQARRRVIAVFSRDGVVNIPTTNGKTMPHILDYLGLRNNASRNDSNRETSSIRFSKISDVDSDGNKLSKEQQEYFKDSKVRDDDGNLLVSYHRTNASFDIFDKEMIGGSGAGHYYGYGFNLSSFDNSVYGVNTIKGYVNITNPLSNKQKTITRTQLKKAILYHDKGISDTIVGEYMADYIPYNSQEYDRKIDRAISKIYLNSESDMDIYANYCQASSNAIKCIDAFKLLGFDGLIEFRNNKPYIYIAFESNQIKNVDNANPTLSPSIRHSKISGKTYEIPKDVKTTLEKENDRYKWLDEYDIQKVNLDDVIKANGYDNRKHGMFSRRYETWGDRENYTYKPEKEDWLYSPIRVREDGIVIDGGHRLYALYNDGYKGAEVLMPKQDTPSIRHSRIENVGNNIASTPRESRYYADANQLGKTITTRSLVNYLINQLDYDPVFRNVKKTNLLKLADKIQIDFNTSNDIEQARKQITRLVDNFMYVSVKEITDGYVEDKDGQLQIVFEKTTTEKTLRDYFKDHNIDANEFRDSMVIALIEMFETKIKVTNYTKELNKRVKEIEKTRNANARIEQLRTTYNERTQRLIDRANARIEQLRTTYNERIQRLIDRANERLSNVTSRYVSALSDMTAQTKENKMRIGSTQRIATKVKRIPREISNSYEITDDNIARDGLNFLFKPFAMLKTNSAHRYTELGLREQLNDVLRLYTKENFEKNEESYSGLEYDPMVRDALETIICELENNTTPVKTRKYKVKDANGKEVIEERPIPRELNSVTLKAISKALTMIENEIRESHRNYRENIKPKNRATANVVKDTKINRKKASRLMMKYFRGFAPAYSVIETMLGNSALTDLIVRDGQNAKNNAQLFEGNYHALISSRLKLYGLKKNYKNMKYEFRGVTLDAGQVIYLLNSLRTQANFDAINESGLVVYDEKGNLVELIKKGDAQRALIGLSYAIPAKDMEKLTKMADFLLELMNTSVKKDYIEWYESKFGKFNFRNEIGEIGANDYWMLRRQYQYEANVDKQVKTPDTIFKHAIKRVNNNNAVLLGDGLSGVMTYISSLSNEKFNKPIYHQVIAILNTKIDGEQTLKDLLLHRIGQDNYNYLLKTISDMIGAKNNGGTVDVLGGIMSRFTVAKLSLKLSTILKQFASIYTSNLPINKSMKTLWNTMFNGKERSQYRDGFLKLLSASNGIGGLIYRNNTVRLSNADGKLTGATEWLADKGMAGITWMDMNTISLGAYTLMTIARDQYGYEIGSKENVEWVKEHWYEFELSQIGNSALSRNAIRRGDYKQVAKVVFGFMQGANIAALGSQIHKVGLYIRNKDVDIVDLRVKLDLNQKELDLAIKEYDAKENQIAELGERIDNSVRESRDNKSNYTKEELEKMKSNREEWREELAKDKDELKELEEKRINKQAELIERETKIKDYESYESAGGKAIPPYVAAGLVAQGILITLVNALIKRLMGKKDWDDWDVQELLTELGLNTATGWVPLVNVIVNLIKGYDVQVPSIDVLNQIGDVFSNFAKKDYKGALKDAITLIGDSTGVPFDTLWDYVYGVTKMINPESAWAMNSLLNSTSLTSMSKQLNAYAEKGNKHATLRTVGVILKGYKGLDTSDAIKEEFTSLYLDGYGTLPKSYMTSYTDSEGNEIELTREQITQFQELYNQANTYVEKVISSSKYQALTSEERAKVLKKIYDSYYAYAKSSVTGIASSNSRLTSLLLFTNGNVDIASLVVALNKVSTITDTKYKTRKELVIEYVNKLKGYTKAQKLLILKLCGYSSNDSNARVLESYLKKIGMNKNELESFMS